jgi:hypothetical protein
VEEDETMRGARYTEVYMRNKQIVALLKEHEAGVRTEDLCWRHGIASRPFGGRPSIAASTSVMDST